jgi:AcrR family transcriptional regulator
MTPDVPARASAARLPAARRRRQLLDIARRTFADRGYHVTSMNDIADAAGVTKPVLYQHFRSKRELYLELLDDVGGHLRATIDEATGSVTSPREQVEAGFRAYFRFVAENEDAFRVLFGGGTRRDEEFKTKVRTVEEAIAEAIAALIEVEGLDRDTRRLLAHGLVGLAEGTSRHWLARGLHGDPDELAAWVSDMAWAGLRGLGTRGPTPPRSAGTGS